LQVEVAAAKEFVGDKPPKTILAKASFSLSRPAKKLLDNV